MADILIVIRRKGQQSLAIISPESEKGRKWIKQKMVAPSSGGDVVFIQSDLLGDFIKELDIDDITYEER